MFNNVIESSEAYKNFVLKDQDDSRSRKSVLREYHFGDRQELEDLDDELLEIPFKIHKVELEWQQSHEKTLRLSKFDVDLAMRSRNEDVRLADKRHKLISKYMRLSKKFWTIYRENTIAEGAMVYTKGEKMQDIVLRSQSTSLSTKQKILDTKTKFFRFIGNTVEGVKAFFAGLGGEFRAHVAELFAA